MRNLWAANYIKYWYKGVSIRKWYLRYTKAAFTVKDEIMRRLGKEVLEMRMAVELERLSRERATMKKISRRAVAALREYIATEEGADEFNIYWRIIRKHRREIKRVELRKLRLLKKRPKSVSGEVAQIIDIKYYDAKELYKDYVKTDWREPAYTCCEERINYESRKVSRENFRREQPPSYDCECCKKPFVFNFLLRRHKLIYDGECEPKVPSHLEWVKADKFSKAAMQVSPSRAEPSSASRPLRHHLLDPLPLAPPPSLRRSVYSPNPSPFSESWTSSTRISSRTG